MKEKRIIIIILRLSIDQFKVRKTRRRYLMAHGALKINLDLQWKSLITLHDIL